MLLAILAILGGLALLVWSADRFVDGAAATARHAGMPPLLIGMVVIGFGTSAPEMVVSALAALDGNPDLALGNAYGSNITNIALILGLVAMLSPIAVQSQVIKKELPLLGAITLLSGALLMDGELDRLDAGILLGVFALLMGWSIVQGLRQRGDAIGQEVDLDLDSQPMALKPALIWLAIGLVLLVISSRILVWGAVTIAHHLGVSDLVIGLTIVAIGTSLPELASSIAAVRKNEHDLALGNVIGSNLFNTLAVVGIAAAIKPMSVEALVLHRDWLVMAVLTVLLFIMGYGFKRQGRINRFEGLILLLIYIGYSSYLFYGIMNA
ncbi:calcium/sodium antiporter [Gallaecimonas pentaromativorans]|uniref:calcium/sodium antiporter n=1 Tax=Gallaecimonas pentaromativorans TaxID=584787 RepID=UPI00067F2FEA|nr:calcium/sodium antiporter [Gallaecimonas pentaromativorans]MED5526511.1 calcium/sodium antiporter [Pseudomonadota bacterium]